MLHGFLLVHEGERMVAPTCAALYPSL